MNKGNLSSTLIVLYKSGQGSYTNDLCFSRLNHNFYPFLKQPVMKQILNITNWVKNKSIQKLQINLYYIYLKLQVFQAFCKVVYTEVKEELGAEEMEISWE